MSIVGPRPIPVYEYEATNDWQRQRNTVKPGLTCIWQVSGRNNIKGKERIEMDIRYTNEFGFITDVILVLKTVPALIFQRGAF
jgi:lipopolysaccharide/colanic/teichoic acid biosynthesis glycosyltransferase